MRQALGRFDEEQWEVRWVDSMKSNVSISGSDIEREIVRIKESFEFENRSRLDRL